MILECVRNPADVRGVKPEGRKNKKIKKTKRFFFFVFSFLFPLQATSRSAAGPPTPSRLQKNIKN
jgi:hypothetical protein